MTHYRPTAPNFLMFVFVKQLNKTSLWPCQTTFLPIQDATSTAAYVIIALAYGDETQVSMVIFIYCH